MYRKLALASSHGLKWPMASKKPLVIVTRKLPEAVETRMRELFDAKLNVDDTPMSSAQLAEAMATADVLVPTITDRIDAKLIANAGPNLKLIANFGAGVDNIDVAAATDKGIAVTNTPGVLTEDTADMTMALILAVPRRLVEGVAAMEDDKFKGWALSGWAASARRWPNAPAPSACRSTITTASPSMPTSSRRWKRPIGKAWTRCWRAWTSCR
jgi:glyoxylate reductase